MSKISVIIPVFNAEKYLPDCLESIIGQTFNDYELIIVNDGSTDNSQRIIDDFAKEYDNIKNYSLQNGGVSKARNFGISVASGEYIVFVDADDTVEKDFLIKLYDNKKVGALTVCGFDKIYLEGKREYRETWKLSDSKEVVSTENFYDVYASWLFNSPCNKLYLKKVFDDNDVAFDIGLNNGEDLIFNARYVNAAGINGFIVVNEPLYNYYVRNVESNSTRYDYSVCEKVLTHRKYVISCLDRFGATEEERIKTDGLFLNQISEYLFIKFDVKTMNVALQNEELIKFLKETFDKKSQSFVESGKFKSIRRNVRRKRKIANIKARIRGVR